VWGSVKILQPRVILATVGSLGDLHPFIALGLALRARGAQVVLAAAAEYRAKVQRAGLDFHAVRPSFADLQSRLGMDRAGLTRAVLARNDFLLRELIMPHLRASYEDMSGLIAGSDLVLTSSLAFGARLAAERLAVPWLGVVLQPLMFLSAFDPPQIPNAAWLSRLLRRWGPRPTRWVLQAVRYALAAQLRPVPALRRDLGLPPTSRHPLFEGQFSPAGAIGLYSPLLGGPQPDHPPGTAIVGFAAFDSDDGGPSALGAALEAFLGAGPRPLVFTLGSLIVHSPGAFFEESVRAARRLGQRAVLLVGDSGLAGHADLAAPDVHVCAYAPHSLLFPRAAALVHQGGIGTLAQALRSGRPQLVVPHYADQVDNAARACALGVARSLSPSRYDARSAGRELGRLLEMPGYAVRADQASQALRKEDGAGRAAAIALDRIPSVPPA
jgi:UDP:flavonoid glycosyltransferase YjiC (YdhE family)